MEKDKKKKKKRKIKKVALSTGCLSPLLVIIIIIFAGIAAVTAVVTAIVKFAIGYEDEKDINKLTLTELVEFAGNEYAITDETLDAMMIDRHTFSYLLEATLIENNKRARTVTKSVEAKHTYMERVAVTPTPVPTPTAGPVAKPGTGNKPSAAPTPNADASPTPTMFELVQRTEDIYVLRDFSSAASEGGPEGVYAVDWQVVYALATFNAINSYKPTPKIVTVDGEEITVTPTPTPIVTDEGYLKPKEIPTETEYDSFFDEADEESGLDAELLKALAKNISGLNPDYSDELLNRYGIMGLDYDNLIVFGCETDTFFDPERNICAGAKCLASYVSKYDGNIASALAAYRFGYDSLPDKKTIKNASTKVRSFVADVLSDYTGNTYLPEMFIDDAKAVIDTSYLFSFGTFEDGRLILSDYEVEELVYDLSPRFFYVHDFTLDGKESYSYEDQLSLPHLSTGDGSKRGSPDAEGTAGDASTGEISYMYWNESLLEKIELPFLDIIFERDEHNNEVISQTCYFNKTRWEAIARKYWPKYNEKVFKNFIRKLPAGENVIAKVESMTYGLESSEDNGITGYYTYIDPYAGVKIGENGMTREWSLTQEDLELIKLDVPQTWNALLGGGFSAKPVWGTYSSTLARKNCCTIRVPIWVWKSADKDDFRKTSSSMSLEVNSRLANMIFHIFTDIYLDESQPVIDPKTTYCYSYRKVVQTDVETYSIHSFGAAIDINYNTSVTYNGKTWTHDIRRNHPAPTLPDKTTWERLPETKEKYQLMYLTCPIANIFRAYGFVWGEDWTTDKDGMHFSFIGDKGSIQKELAMENHRIFFR